MGDRVTTISPSWGISGDKDYIWKYELGKSRLESMGLIVEAAPNSIILHLEQVKLT